MAKILYYNKPPKPIDFPIDPDAEILYVQDEYLDDFKAMNPDIQIFKPYNFKVVVVNPLRGDVPVEADYGTITYQDILDGTDTESKLATAKAIHDGVNYFINKKEDDVHLFLQAVEDEGVITFVDDDAFRKIDEFVAHNPNYTSNVKIEVDDRDVYYLTNYEAGEYYNFSSINPTSEVFYGLQLSGATVTYKTFSGSAPVDDLTTEMVDDKLQANAIIDVDVFPTKQADIKEGTFYRKRNDHFYDADDNEVIPLTKYICDGEHVQASAIGLVDLSTGIPTPWNTVTDAVVNNFIASSYVTTTEAIGDTPYSLYFIKVAENSYSHLMCIHNKVLYHHEDGAWKAVSEDAEPDNTTITKVNDKLQANAIIEVDSLPTRVEDIKKNTLYKSDVREIKDEDGFYINPSVTYKADGTHVQILADGLRDVDNDTLYEWVNVNDSLISQFVNSSYLEEIVDYGDEKEVNCVGKLKDNVYIYCNAVLNKVLYTYSDDAWKLVSDYKDIKNCDEKTIFTNVYNKLESKAIIDEDALPTSGIISTTIYRVLEDVYKYNDDEIEVPQGYRGTSENISVSESGITFNSTEYPFETLTDVQLNEITDKETCDFDDAEWFKIANDKYDYKTTVTKEQVYRLYHNPTGQADEYVKIGGAEGGSADVEIDNTTITNVNDKLQANAILEVDDFPTTNIKEDSLYRIMKTIYKHDGVEVENVIAYTVPVNDFYEAKPEGWYNRLNNTLTPWDDANIGAVIQEAIEGEWVVVGTFETASFFAYGDGQYDHESHFGRKLPGSIYQYLNTTWKEVGGDPMIDEVTIVEEHGIMQSLAVLDVVNLPMTNIKKAQLYRKIETIMVPGLYVYTEWYHAGQDPIPTPLVCYKSANENVEFKSNDIDIYGTEYSYEMLYSQANAWVTAGYIEPCEFLDQDCGAVGFPYEDGYTFLNREKYTYDEGPHEFKMTKIFQRTPDDKWDCISTIEMSQEAYSVLTEEQKMDGTTYIIPD